MSYAKPVLVIVGLWVAIMAVSLALRNADVRECEEVCDRAVLACASQQSGTTTSTGILACESLGRQCAKKCEDDLAFRKEMVSP